MTICTYLIEAATLVEAEYPELWAEFRSDEYRSSQVSRVELDLLRRTEALDGPHATRILDLSQEVAKELEVDRVAFFLNQPQGEGKTVPRLCFIPNEVHLVVSPAELGRLSDQQIRAVLAHEVAHYWLWTTEDGRYRHAELLLAALAARGDQPAALETERNYRRFTELVCDRVSLRLEDDVNTLATAIRELERSGKSDGQSFDDQSFEEQSFEDQALEQWINSETPPANRGGSHPSWAMRCWAAARWLDVGPECEAAVRKAVTGPASMDHPCLLRQRELRDWSHWILSRLTEPNWIRTSAVMAHANLFFSDGLDSVDPAGHSAGAVTSQVDSMIEQLNEVEDEGIRDYLAYVTLDIATVDRNLEHYPVAWALEVWERVDWGSHVRDIIGRELNLGKRQLQKLYRDRADIVSEAAKKHSPN